MWSRRVSVIDVKRLDSNEANEQLCKRFESRSVAAESVVN